ncbi:MAG: Hydrolase [Myxococcales bacterium]|nr:Hydrolase [Myxococcales bacterium]
MSPPRIVPITPREPTRRPRYNDCDAPRLLLCIASRSAHRETTDLEIWRYAARVSTVAVPGTPLLPGVTPVELHVREVGAEVGSGVPLLILHGGWGYAFYPFDAQIAALTDRRIVIPDRTGYGRSPHVTSFPRRFHAAAAAEALAFLDGLGIEKCAIWGHSDGAVIAAWLGIHTPDRVTAVILEALHLDRTKPGSRAFFEMMATDPDGFGERVTRKLAAEHGEAYWRTVLRAGGAVWLDIAATPDDDLYDHRLQELRVPTLVLHGADDPRTEPRELDRLRREVPHAEVHLLAGAGHSPHSERGTAQITCELAISFLARATA